MSALYTEAQLLNDAELSTLEAVELLVEIFNCSTGTALQALEATR